jgi:putative transposase
VAAEALLFDDGFDGIEDRVRARVRGFIETMLEAELCEAVSRPRYGRRKPGADEAAATVVGVRHGRRERTLTAFGKTRIAVGARAVDRRGRQDARMAERFAAPTSAAPGPPTP